MVIIYYPPAGELGSGVAKLLNPVFEKLIRQDVLNFKEYIETKHNPKTESVGKIQNSVENNFGQ